MRRKPTDNFRVAAIISIPDRYIGYGDPSLVLLEVSDTNSSPIVIKKQVDGCISWSPDGKYIAYGNGRPRDKRDDFPKGIYFIDYRSGSITKLSDTDGYYPVWSSDGNTIAFLTNEGISIIDVTTKEENQVYSGSVLALMWGR